MGGNPLNPSVPGSAQEVFVLHFKAFVEQTSQGKFRAVAPEFAGVVSYGETSEAAQAALESALLKHLSATSSVALEAVHEEPLRVTPYASCSHGDRLYIATNLDIVLVTDTGKKESWKRVPVTQQSADVLQVFEGDQAEEVVEPGEDSTQIYSLAVFAGAGGEPAMYAGTNLKGQVYVNDAGAGWRPAFSTDEERVHSLVAFGGRLYAGTSSHGRIFRWDGQQVEVVHQSNDLGITALAVHENALYAGTYPEGFVVRTMDGELWEIVCRTNQKMINQFLSAKGTLYAACSSASGGTIFRSLDGQLWERCFLSEKDQNVYALASFGGRLYAGTGEGGRLFASRDGSRWEVVVQSPETALRVVAVHKGRLYVGCERRGIVYRTAGTEAPPPVIKDVQVTALTSAHAFLEWSTDVPCDATVQYGVGPVRDQTVNNATLSRRHRVALNGLKAGTRHTFLITAHSAEGNEAVYLSENGFITPVLSPPALSVTTHPEEERWYATRDVKIQWEPVPGAAGYVYKFSPQRVTHLTLDDAQTNDPSVFTTVEADGVWYCAVAGVDEAGNIGEVSLRGVRCDTVVPVPTVTSTSHPESESWYHSPLVELKAEGSDPASGADGFLFAIGRVGEVWEHLAFQRASGPTWTLPRLPDGTWEIFVRLCDKAGNESQPTSLRVSIDTAPPLVAIDPVPAITRAGELELTWQARDERSGVGKVYVQQRRESGAQPAAWETVYEGAGSAVKVEGQDGWRVWYRVVVEDRAGLKAAAETHHPVLFDGSPPAPVTVLEVESLTGGDLQLKWAPVQDAFSEIVRYHIYRGSVEGRLGMKIATITANVLEYVDEGVGLAHGGRYFYRVASEDGVGNIQTEGATQSGVSDKEAPPPRLTSPTHPPDQWTTLTEAVLQWERPADDTGIQEYLWRLDRNPSSSLVKGVDESLKSPPLSLSRLLDGLWYVHVAAVDGAGNVSSAAHYPLRVATRPPHARLKALPSLVNKKRVKLEWEREEGVVAVAIGVRKGGAQAWETLVEHAEGNEREVEVAREGVHEFSVRAIDTYGRWGVWEEGQVTLVDESPPLEIPTLQATSLAGGSVRLEWDPSWDELSGLAMYRIFRSRPGEVRGEKIAEVPATEECVLTDPCEGAEDGTRFVYTVWPSDTAGNMLESGPSAEAVCDRSAPPPKLVVRTHPDPTKAYASRKLEVDWEAADDLTGVAGVVVEINAISTTQPNPETLPVRTDRTMTFDLPEDGRWFLHARTVDGAGNASETVHCSVRVDTHVDPPVVSFAQDPFLEWKQTGSVTAVLRPPEDSSGVPAFWCLLDQDPETTPDRVTGTRYTGKTLKVGPKHEGTWYLHVAAEDGAGNISLPVHLGMRLTLGLPLPHILKSSHPEGMWSQRHDVEIAWDKIEGDRVTYLYWLDPSRQDDPPPSAMRVSEPVCRFTIEGGIWYLHICAVDERDRKSSAVAYQIRVDATPPAVTVYSRSHPKESWSPRRRVHYAIEVEDEHSGIARAELAFLPTGQVPSIWELALGTEGEREVPGEGSWTIWARAVDLAGNVSPLASWEIKVDLSAQAPVINSPTHLPDQWSAAPQGEFWLQPGEDLSGVEAYAVQLFSPGEEVPVSPLQEAAWSAEEIVHVAIPGEGRWTLAAWARDLAGNLSLPARYTLLSDFSATAPSGFVVEPSSEGGWIRSSEVQVSWKPPEEISGEPQGYLYVVDRQSETVPEPGEAGFTAFPSLDLGDLEDGISHLHVRTLDAAGNASAGTVHLKLSVDGRPPRLTLTSPEVSGGDWIRGRHVTICAQGEDGVSGFVGCFWTLHEEGERAPEIIGGRWREGPDWGVDIPHDGAWVVTVAAMDGAGNLSEPQQLVVRIDAAAAAPQAVHSSTHSKQGVWYASREVTLQWEEPEETSGVRGYRYTVAHNAEEMGTPKTWKRVAKPPLKIKVPDDGKWVLAVVTEDGAGNLSFPTLHHVWVDGVVAPPSLRSPTHPKSSIWYPAMTVQVQVEAEDEASGIREILLGVSESGKSDPVVMKPVLGSTVVLELKRGEWWLHAVAVDQAGNRSAPASINIKVDPAVRPPLVVCESHPDPETWYANMEARFKIIPAAGAEDKQYWAVFDERPDTQPVGQNSQLTPPGVFQVSAARSGEWYLHMATATDGESLDTEAVHLKVRIDVASPPAPVVRSPSHPPAPRRVVERDAGFEWGEPKDLSGIKEYMYTCARQALLGKRERRGTTTACSVSLAGLEPGVWDFSVVATDFAGQTGEPGRYTIAISNTQDLGVITKSEIWRAIRAPVEIELRSGEKTVKKVKSDSTGEAWFRNLPYESYTVAITLSKNNPPLEFEEVALEEREPHMRLEVSLAGCAWMICRNTLRLWVPDMWLEGGRVEVLPEKGYAAGVKSSTHMLKDLPKRGAFLECPLPDNLLTGAFRFLGGPLTKLQWPPLPFTRLPF